MSLRPYLQLVRLPNVFTSISNIISGFIVVRSFIGSTTLMPWRILLLLCGASACLYLSGMAFNDVADAEEDSEFRPNRPIPSGRVGLHAASLIAILLMSAGIFLAWEAGGAPFNRALILAICILLYDFYTKHLAVLGPITLGLCRIYNMQLGISAIPLIIPMLPWDGPMAVALAMGLYAAGLTAFSAQEERGKRAFSIAAGWTFCGLAFYIAGANAPYRLVWTLLLPLAGTLLFLSVRLYNLGTPFAARDLVRTGVMGICIFDAAIVLGYGGPAAWPFALACAGLLVPSLVIAKLLAQREA